MLENVDSDSYSDRTKLALQEVLELRMNKYLPEQALDDLHKELHEAIVDFPSHLREADLVQKWKRVSGLPSVLSRAMKDMVDIGFNNAEKAPAMVTAILALLKVDGLICEDQIEPK